MLGRVRSFALQFRLPLGLALALCACPATKPPPPPRGPAPSAVTAASRQRTPLLRRVPRGYLLELDLRRLGAPLVNHPECFRWPRSCYSGGIGASTLFDAKAKTMQLREVDPGRYALKTALFRPGQSSTPTHRGALKDVLVGQRARILEVTLRPTRHVPDDNDAISRVIGGPRVVRIELSAPPLRRADGPLCKEPSGHHVPGYGCNSNEQHYRCTFTLAATRGKPQRRYSVETCSRSVMYTMIAAKLCEHGATLPSSRYAKGFTCEPVRYSRQLSSNVKVTPAP
jgi:hypothetical protein